MKIALKHVTLHSPDELLTYWFVSHGFAGSLGLEYSRDAARALKKAIGPKLARIDYGERGNEKGSLLISCRNGTKKRRDFLS